MDMCYGPTEHREKYCEESFECVCIRAGVGGDQRNDDWNM